MVKLLFKTPSKEQPFELDIDIAQVTNVEQLKQKVADHTGSTVPNIKLIHKGKILKDDLPLASLNLTNGETFHAVIKVIEAEKPASEPQPATNTSSSQQVPNPNANLGGGLGGFGGLGGLGGMGGLGGGLGGMGGMGGMGMDPQAMASMMDMMTPEMMNQVIESNPMLKTMVDSNPQMKAIISNPALMKSMIQNMNPMMMQQAMSQMGGLGGMGAGGMGGLGGFGGMGGYGGLGGFGGLGAGLGAGNSPTSTSPNTNFKELYKAQLEQLQGMGFTNESVNIDALKATGGNVEAAVERLLNMLG